MQRTRLRRGVPVAVSRQSSVARHRSGQTRRAADALVGCVSLVWRLTSRKREPLEMNNLVKTIDVISKIIGFIGVLGAAISFSMGNTVVSVLSVCVAYVGFMYLLGSIVFSKKVVASSVLRKEGNVPRKVYAYKRYQRIASGAGMIVISIILGVWGYMLLRNTKVDVVSEDKAPTIILPSSDSPASVDGKPYFTAEKVEIDSNFYGVSKDTGAIWEVVSTDSDSIDTVVGRVSIGRAPTAVLKALLMSPKPVVVNGLSVVIVHSLVPPNIQEIDIFGKQPVGGGGPVENIAFTSVEFDRKSKIISLTSRANPNFAHLPYSLEENEALVVSVPLKPLENGLYSFYLLAEVLDYKGNQLRIKSKTLVYGYLALPADEIESQPISISTPSTP